MRHRLSVFIVLVLLVATVVVPTTAKASTGSFVTRNGVNLNLNGQPYRFTGINIYNANSNRWCWYAMDGHILDDSLAAINPSGGVFRAWFFQQLATTNGVRDWTAFDRSITAARNHGFRVIATLIDQWGDCGASTSPGYGYKDETWYRSRYNNVDPLGTTSYLGWVQEVAARYKDDPTVLAWQLVNEAEVKTSANGSCAVGAAQILKDFAANVSGVIKGIDPNHLVSLGTIGSGQCGAQGAEYSDVHNVATIDLCEYHDYSPNDPMPGDVFNGLQLRINQCNALDKPLFIGESGIKPVDVGGTVASRARAFQAKLTTQFAAGVVGDLVWAWDKNGSLLDNYDIGPGDPVLGVLAAWSTTGPGAWPMFRGSAQHVGQSAIFGPTTSAIKWSFQFADQSWYDASPVISPDGTVYFGGVGPPGFGEPCPMGFGKIDAFNPDGTLKWEFTTAPTCDAPTRTGPAVAPDGTVYFVGDMGLGSLWALNPTGTLRWQTPALHLQSSPTIGPDGTIYESDGFQYVYAFNPDGSQKWRFAGSPGSRGSRSSPALGLDGTVYVGTSGGSLIAIDPLGSLKWEFVTDDGPNGLDVAASPAVGPDGTIYVGSCGASIFAIHPDGTLKWRDQVSYCVESSPAIANDGSVYVGGDDFNVYGINPDGTPKWTFVTNNFVFSSPAVGADGLVYIAGGNGLLYAFNPDGTIKWTFQQPYSFYSSPAIGSDGTLYVSAFRTVYAFANPLLSPADAVAAAGDATASVSWLPPTSDGGRAITGYTVTANPGPATLAVAAGVTTARIGGLTNGVSYTFTVTVTNAAGVSATSGASNAVTPQPGAAAPVTAEKLVPPSGGTVTTDPGTGPTPSLPVTSAVTIPAGSPGGIVSITQSSVTTPAPTGFTLVGQQIRISAPASTPNNPLVLTFALDTSALAGQAASSIQIYRTEGSGSAVAVPDCTGAPSVASPDPCVASRTATTGGGAVITVWTSIASLWNFAIPRTAQTITFATLGNKSYGDPPFTVNASASSGLAVSFTVSAADQCTIAGNTVTITGAGGCTVTAAQPGNRVYSSAPSVPRTFSIAKAATAILLNSTVNPAFVNQATKLTAGLSWPAGTRVPTGTITFFEGTRLLGTSAVDASGVSLLTFQFSVAGHHQLNAVYGGDTNFKPSTSSVLVQLVKSAKIAFFSNRDGNLEIYVMDSSGANQTRLTTNPASDSQPSFSPDGTQVAFVSTRSGSAQIWIMNATPGSPAWRLTSDGATDSGPSWSPDGKVIAYASTVSGQSQLWAISASGTGATTRLLKDSYVDATPAWSPDGAKLAFTSTRGGKLQVWVIGYPTAGTPVRITSDSSNVAPAWAPDGTKIAFTSTGSGSPQIWLVATAPGATPTQLTHDTVMADFSPTWSPDGSEIAFTGAGSTSSNVYKVKVTGSGEVGLTSGSTHNASPNWCCAQAP